jgi:hypothetical protein
MRNKEAARVVVVSSDQRKPSIAMAAACFEKILLSRVFDRPETPAKRSAALGRGY